MLKLDENYAIGADPLNIILYQRKVTKKGKTPGTETWRAIRYYRNCENALEGLVDLKINSTDLKDLETIVREIQATKAMIVKLRG